MGLVILKKNMKKKTDMAKLKLLLNTLTRLVVRPVLKKEKNGKMRIENLLDYYSKYGKLPRGLRNYLFMKVIDIAREALGIEKSKMREYAEHPNIRRTLINAFKSLDVYGTRFPMRFYAPLMIVWNITYRCNLKCKHCYEDAGILGVKGVKELTIKEKLKVVDEIADSFIPTLSFSGGEPLTDPDFWKVAERASKKGLYLSMNTNGTLITEKVAQKLKDLDFAYVSISLDSTNPSVHDVFRGVKGSWKKAVQGFKNLKKVGISTVVGFTITKYNYKNLPEMFEFIKKNKIDKVMIYNFIPVGRGRGIIADDLSPEEREDALKWMHQFSLEGGSLCTTAPQLGRVCKENNTSYLIPLSHTGPGRAKNMKVLADLIGGCGVGRCYMALQPDGRITPCVYMPNVDLGNIKKDTFLKIWHTSPLLKSLARRDDLKGHCGKCEHQEVCSGCRARAHAYFGDFKAPDPGCINNKEAYMKLMRIPEIQVRKKR